ncbi:prepilin-type N-terminal cleavage/methylation domain-containing protein [Labrenzia sp. PHM005]|uniref:type IV pilus modification PilV family protein n=1 Tax=Labrenzia sp. PHM005 TaxID=2590016 RepID=UPI0011405006|nr:type II secretion system protein [Labrenzia sp. PHM005]QDG74405.1 type II secretion system protein [Labrenzia sp. PHM005]
MPFIRGGKGGFTLLETLIAFAIFGMFFIAVHKSFRTALSGSTEAVWSDAAGQAIRSELARIQAGAAEKTVYRTAYSDTLQIDVTITSTPSIDRNLPIDTKSLRQVTLVAIDSQDNTRSEMSVLVRVDDRR